MSPRSQYVHRAAVSCAMPLAALHRCQVTTVEGLGTSRNPHKVGMEEKREGGGEGGREERKNTTTTFYLVSA